VGLGVQTREDWRAERNKAKEAEEAAARAKEPPKPPAQPPAVPKPVPKVGCLFCMISG
jgi:hypothetical protein